MFPVCGIVLVCLWYWIVDANVPGMSLPGAAGKAGQPTPGEVEQTNVPGYRGEQTNVPGYRGELTNVSGYRDEQANVCGHIGGAIWCTGAEVSGA